ncbi:nicotinamide riboside transporter PnuC [Corallincola spongiicola]|uniref:Nicotinamide riboside transporter PnuC n=1 Tax=Corallincola spongiicola TaxID=2520508 RepID=A0ABY1WTJ8_9GAMM|nr:nicotinamide riboside transporter PnuC [Corallincola spongiicola]TAA48069.1 nicotinamide riboside transporter PnuC [Corallincola spongiicola]
MTEQSFSWWQQAINQLHGMWGWELVAVILALAYLILAMNRSQWCWPAAFASTLIYTVLFWQVALLMESALNVYYMIMAIYGFYLWHRDTAENQQLMVISWSGQKHFAIVSVVTLLSLIAGYLMSTYTHAEFAYLDAATTCFAVYTTYLVAIRVLQNWLYWIVIDGVSIYLYFEKGLYLTALLFAIYIVLAILGYFSWQRKHRQQELSQCHQS